MIRVLSLVLFFGTLYLWVRRRWGAARRWGKLCKAAFEAEKRGDLTAAECAWRDADAFAGKQSGVLWRRRLTITKEPLARVLFKAGQLERSAALTFDVLEQSHGAT
jgi:hypothetical protein